MVRGARPWLSSTIGTRAYTALTETADPGQDPQKGGLLLLHRGKGTYIYVAFALYRQFPELVPGAYRLLANLLSAGYGRRGWRPLTTGALVSVKLALSYRARFLC